MVGFIIGVWLSMAVVHGQITDTDPAYFGYYNCDTFVDSAVSNFG